MGKMTPPPTPIGASVTAVPAWGALVEEADQPPVWEEHVVFVRDGSAWAFWLSAQAWRTKRMDVNIICENSDINQLFDQQTEVFKELAWEVTRCLDWAQNVRIEAKVDYTDNKRGHQTCIRKIIIQVGDGKQLEPVINLIARFKERWS